MESETKEVMASDFVCPKCHGNLIKTKPHYECTGCETKYPVNNGVPDFRPENAYWCNVAPEIMRDLIDVSIESKDWEKAAETYVKQYMGHFKDFQRGDFQFMLPLTPDSRVLDAGSMWGALTLPIAQFVKEMYALDMTQETLEFLKVRANQLNINNIKTVASPLKKTPFPDDHFDLIILNGVLEWVGVEEEVILTRDWEGTREEMKSYVLNPRTMQSNVLKELRRILKPDGILYVAIENRYNFMYFMGYPDDHINLRWVPFLPRKISNFITKKKLNTEYRTYIYGFRQLKKLLKESGFEKSICYGSYLHYGNPNFIASMDKIQIYAKELIKSFIIKAKNKFFSFLPTSLLKIGFPLVDLIPSFLWKSMSPSIFALAGNQQLLSIKKSRLAECLNSCLEIQSRGGIKDIVLVKSREGNELTASFHIFCSNSNTADFYCKVCRNSQHPLVLQDEMKHIQKVKNKINQDPELLPGYVELIENSGLTVLLYSFTSGKTHPVSKFRPPVLFYVNTLNRQIMKAIPLLARFQKKSKGKAVTKTDLLAYIDKWGAEIDDSKKSEQFNNQLNGLKQNLSELGEPGLSECSVHGDFDLCNIIVHGDNQHLVDYEHFEEQGLPFFDFANLCINALLIAFENKIFKGEKYYSLAKKLMINWTKEYCSHSIVSQDLMKYLGPLAALEQQSKKYPSYRNPESYPMYVKDNFQKLLDWDFLK